MKNLLSILAIAAVMMLGMGSMSAQTLSQDENRPEVIAKAKVADMTSKLSLNGDQQRSLFRAYTAYESNMKKHVAGKNIADPAVQANKKKFDDVLNESVKKSLNSDQYKKWVALQKM